MQFKSSFTEFTRWATERGWLQLYNYPKMGSQNKSISVWVIPNGIVEVCYNSKSMEVYNAYTVVKSIL